MNELPVGTVVQSLPAAQSIWTKTETGWTWTNRFTGEVEEDYALMSDEQALTDDWLYVHGPDGNLIKPASEETMRIWGPAAEAALRADLDEMARLVGEIERLARRSEP